MYGCMQAFEFETPLFSVAVTLVKEYFVTGDQCNHGEKADHT